MVALCTRAGSSALVNGSVLRFQSFTVIDYMQRTLWHVPLCVTCASISLGYKL